MAKIKVILEASTRDKNTRKYFREVTKLADGYTASVNKAAAAMAGLGSMPSMPVMPGRGGGGGGRAGAGRRAATPQARKDPAVAAAKNRAKQEREFDRALTSSIRDAKAQARALDKEARAQQRSAKLVENLTKEQLNEIELQKEINRRRRGAAKAAAQKTLGADPTAKGRGNRGRGGGDVEFGANLAIAGAEFEQFGAQVEGGIRSSFSAFSDYEKGVAEVSTLTDNIPVDKIEEITRQATEEFGGLPTDQVSAFYAIVSAGATNAADAQAQLTAANKLAIGGAATQEGAVLAVSKAVANFGGTSEEAADSIFVAVKRGQTTVEEMSRALPAVAQAAAAAGLDVDETNAAISVLSTRFASAKEGATAMRQALSNISKPTKGARKEAKRLGIDFSNAGIEAAGGIEGFLVKLRAAEKFDENTLAKLFDSTEARAAVGGLIDGMDDYRVVLADMEKKQGAADTAYAKMADTTAQKTAILEGQMELLKIQAGEALVPALTWVAEELAPVLTGFTEFIKQNPRTVSQLAKLAIGAAIVARGAGVLTSAISMWKTVSGLSAASIGGLGKSVDGLGESTVKTGKLARGFNATMGAVPTVFAGASAAILAFNFVLDGAQKPLTKYEDKLKDIEEQQKNISFKRELTEEEEERVKAAEDVLAATTAAAEKSGKVSKKEQAKIDEASRALEEVRSGVGLKTEEELLSERRKRLAETVNAARQLTFESAGGGAWEQLEEGEVVGAFGAAYGGLLNQATGVSEEQERQQRQAELDLARFDVQYGEQLGLTPEQTFTAGGGGAAGTGATVEALRALMGPLEQVAANTSGQPWQGPSMEAGAAT